MGGNESLRESEEDFPNNVYGDSVDFRTLYGWMAETLRADRRLYETKPRELTLERLRRIFRPNLYSPVFIVGSPRSGTSFLGESIGAMPSVSYHHEPIATKAATRFVWDERWDRDFARMLFRSTFGLSMAIHLDGDLRFAQKTPRHSFIVDFLYDVFDDAKVIHLVRDGRDVVASYVEKPWLSERAASGQIDPGGAPHGPYPRFWVEPSRRVEFRRTTDAHRCAWSWRRHVEAARSSLQKRPPSSSLTLRYERLVDAPEDVGEELVDFLAIDRRRDREALSHALGDARADSVGRGSRDLTDEQLAAVDEEAGDLLETLGYRN